MSTDRPARSSRPSGDNRSSGRPSTGRSAGAKSTSRDGRPVDGRRSAAGRSESRRGGGSDARRSGGSDGRRNADRRQERPLTAAERRALEVKLRRAPRAPRDPELERQKIDDRTLEVWIDDGSIREEASNAARRGGAASDAPASSKRRPPKPLDPEVQAELVDSVGKQRGARLSERLAQASEALDRERFQEARRVAGAIAKEAPDIATAHEVLGLACYRLGLFKPAVRSLETAQDLRPDAAMMPVIADCYRALGRWSSVERVWGEIKELSPAHEVIAEGRIVAAGALADQGDLRGAIAVMEPATRRSKVVREHHLRSWYVLGDLHDRVGDPISARRWFSMVADADPEFADVEQRLRSIGR
jgi:tetratricopeptide (TPR) repeat protein